LSLVTGGTQKDLHSRTGRDEKKGEDPGKEGKRK